MVHDVSCKVEVANLVKKFPDFTFVYGLFNDAVSSYGLDSRNSISVKRNIFFFYPTAPKPAPRPTERHIEWVPGALFPGVKPSGCQPDHSPPASAEVKNGAAIPPLPNKSSWRGA
jgi:hypothetical protein